MSKGEEGTLGKRQQLEELEEDRQPICKTADDDGYCCENIGEKHKEPFVNITHSLIIKVDLGKIMTGDVKDFAILARDQDQRREIYSLVLRQADGQEQLVFLDSRNTEQHHTKILAYKTSTLYLSNLMPIEDNEQSKALLFVQTPREKPEDAPHKSELVLFLREKKVYKVIIKVLKDVNEMKTIFKIGNSRNVMAVYVPQTKLYFLYGLKDPQWHETIQQTVLSIIPTHPLFQDEMVDISLQEKIYINDQFDEDMIYCCMLFNTGKIGLLVTSKKLKAQVGQIRDINTWASSNKQNGGKVIQMYFKPNYNTLAVINETPDHDYIIELFAITFNKDDLVKPIEVVRHEQHFFVRRDLLVDPKEDTNIHFAITETFVNMSLEILVIPENMFKFTAFKIKYNKESKTHETVKFGQLENYNFTRRENERGQPTPPLQRMPHPRRLQASLPDISDPDQTDNDDENDLLQRPINPGRGGQIAPMLEEFGEDHGSRENRVTADHGQVQGQFTAPPNKSKSMTSNLKDCLVFDPSANLTANCNAFTDKSRQMMFIFKK